MARLSGTEGYGETAHVLVEQYEKLTFDEVHGDLLHLFPATPARVLDIGAGTGRDAAALAALGYSVVAVEPTAEMRALGQRLHASAAIDWIDDGLPDLAHVRASGKTFDLVLLTAVWMHLDAEQRERAMPAVASLMRPDGVMKLSLRHGPIPAGRRMFDVSADETSALANRHGLTEVHRNARKSLSHAADVQWDVLVFRYCGSPSTA
ncbi:MAG: methyltransferase domain-containing protein [Alphaproteobacteria bacterium]|nr:methyltransferase domain-containing protein [Alphaproteobacteria bacterium]